MAHALRRAGDFVARYGGEEFATVLPDTPTPQALETAKNILNAVDELAIPHKTSPVLPHVTISIGIATLTPENATGKGKTPHQKRLIEAADKKLYEAKSIGRHAIAY